MVLYQGSDKKINLNYTITFASSFKLLFLLKTKGD